VLLSGDHARIRRWRQEQREKATRERRPDLWERRERRKI
jgi:tRNA (guanine37-N1)-methyltransferase